MIGQEWSPERIEQLRKLWNEGHSTRTIASMMGMTKNAIIGKAHRLHLPGRGNPIRRDGVVNPKRLKRARGATLPPLASVSPAAAPPSAARPAPPPTPINTRVRPCSPCCWPIGEPGKPDFRFCDAGAMPGRPYCEPHCALAYVAKSDPAEQVRGDLNRLDGMKRVFG